jgi:hypothetical protein
MPRDTSPSPNLGCAILRSFSFAILSLSGCARSSPVVPCAKFDAGFVSPYEKASVSHEFAVINPTADIVNIQNIRKTCSCTSYSLKKHGCCRAKAQR